MNTTKRPRRDSQDPRLDRSEAKAFDRAMSRSMMMTNAADPLSVVIRAACLGFAWVLIAQAIRRDGLGVGFVVAPWVLEFLAIQWLGPLLARFAVRDRIFRKIAGGPLLAAVWTVVLLTPYVLGMAWQEGFSVVALQQRMDAALPRALETGVATACALVLAGLLIDTIRDLRRWDPADGPFVWPATQRLGLRFAFLLGLTFLAPFVLAGLIAILAIVGDSGSFQAGQADFAWLAFGVLALTDTLVLALGILMHQKPHLFTSKEDNP
ncbi:MAG: hypothetical protein AAGE01_14440 [Pseudomonadota bacterium]